VQQKAEQAPQGRKDAEGRKRHAAWPLDVMVAASSAVVDRGLVLKRVSEELGIPYTTLTEWVKKYRAGGRAALQARPARGPERVKDPVKVDARRDAVLAAKRDQPQAGSRRVRDVVRRFFGIGTSETTVRRVLQQEGLSEKCAPPKAKPRAKERRFERAEPNQLWQSDLFTFLLRKHERVYVAAFLDDHSRYLVSLVMAHHQRSSLVLEALARAIADYGAPREILTDQGRQYTAWRGVTGFEEELRRQGIRHVKSRPHHPQTCGKIERFWKTMWEEFLARTVFADFDDCQRRSALFVQHYNFQRPHQGLEGLTPADRFFRSAPQVRAAIESTVAANALRLAREQPPRKPFYLVGRLGDRDLTISASGTGLKVRVGEEETTIGLIKEGQHEEATSASRCQLTNDG
jgi:transposase InsO family protein